jgi:hypothetical protein
MPGLVPGIHGLLNASPEDVDGPDKPGHDNVSLSVYCTFSPIRLAIRLR